jgi:UPF0755 protein
MLDDLDLAWEEQDPNRQRRGGPPTRQVRQRRRKEKKRRRRSFGALFISLVMLAALGFGVYWGVGKVQDIFGASDYTSNPATTPVMVKIESGDFAGDIATKLYNQKVVKSEKAFIAAAAADPRSKTIQPGTYKLFEQMPASAALAILIDPKNIVGNKVLITEGMITVDIYAKLAKASGIPLADFVTAGKDPVALGVDPAWFSASREDGRPVIKSVEGFLFPDTYMFSPDMTATDMLKAMVTRFNQVAGDLKFTDTVTNNLHITPYEALIAASIAQAEAQNADDFAKVARVLYNRSYGTFACNCLGLDSEVNYWLTISGKETAASENLTYNQLHDPADIYNTHDKPGLPGGAISNPGKEAMQGAMAPVGANNVFYFLTVDKQGTMAYASTKAQFDALVKTACKNGIPLC